MGSLRLSALRSVTPPVLYRGTSLRYVSGGVVDYTDRMSSWSKDLDVAQTFAGDNGVVMKWEPTTGDGLLDISRFNKYEAEVISTERVYRILGEDKNGLLLVH